MSVWKQVGTLAATAPIDRVAAYGDVAVVAQSAEDLLGFEIATGRQTALPRIPPGSNLLAISAAGERLLFDNSGNVVRSDSRGAEISRVPLGPDVELVEARDARSALVLLVAESIGEQMDLGVPRFSFVVCDGASVLKRLPHALERAPAWWFANLASDRLFVYGEQRAAPLAFDLSSGEPVDVPRGLRQRWRKLEVTGAALSGDGNVLAITLWNPEHGVGEIRLAAANDARNKLVLILSTSDGCPRNPSWAPDGQSIVFCAGATESPLVIRAAVDAQGKCERLITMQPDGALLWCGARLVVQTSDRTLEVFGRAAVRS